MEPSTELLQLLREIRDGQRELLAQDREWMERSERQYRQWELAQVEYEARVARDRGAAARADEANELWLQQNRAWAEQNKGGEWKRIGVLVLALLAACGAASIGFTVLNRLGL